MKKPTFKKIQSLQKKHGFDKMQDMINTGEVCEKNEEFEMAKEVKDKIDDDVKATAQFNSIMANAPLEICVKMLEENNDFILNELRNNS